MKEWFTQQIAKFLGPTFVSRAATSLVALLLGYLNTVDLGLAPEVITQFGETATQVVAGLLSILSVWVIDTVFSKKEEKKSN